MEMLSSLGADNYPYRAIAYEVVRQVITLSLPTLGNKV